MSFLWVEKSAGFRDFRRQFSFRHESLSPDCCLPFFFPPVQGSPTPCSFHNPQTRRLKYTVLNCEPSFMLVASCHGTLSINATLSSTKRQYW